ncbi:Uu.00g075360.m01.CDS01 [Anthostomella pinea]|uniref:Uu.00g075360.m01.CDS01 n=1 Tax=Anthostomella pinea TaxID=933095 RepID=A0AAI8VVN3_9PEZI|nr:Uu.00g075360.m01.CDS01 [Anthostomella pinea]
MAIIELVYPQFKSEGNILQTIEEEFFPIAVKTLHDGGVIDGIRGFIVSYNGIDVTSDVREVLVLEWPTEEKFTLFVKTEAFARFQAAMKPFVKGPPVLKLFETNEASKLFGSAPVLEILEIAPKETTDGEKARDVLQKVLDDMKKTKAAGAVYGTSLNLDQKQVVIVELFTDTAALQAAQETASRREFLESIHGLASVTQLVAKVEKMPL